MSDKVELLIGITLVLDGDYVKASAKLEREIAGLSGEKTWEVDKDFYAEFTDDMYLNLEDAVLDKLERLIGLVQELKYG